MRNVFVRTTNVRAFEDGIARVNQRGAPEASLMLVHGDAGHGKSRTGQWWATQHAAAHITVKAAATPAWMLMDLVRELGEMRPEATTKKLYVQAFKVLARERVPIVIDDVEHAMKNMDVLETIRQLSDDTEVVVVLIGRDGAPGRMRRENQIWSRLSAVVPFAPAAPEDVRLCCDELAEVEIADEVASEIHKQSEGRMRQIMNGIKNCERIGARGTGKVGIRDIQGRPLCHDFQRQKPKLKAV